MTSTFKAVVEAFDKSCVDQAVEENGSERLRLVMPRDGDGSNFGMLLKPLVEWVRRAF